MLAWLPKSQDNQNFILVAKKLPIWTLNMYMKAKNKNKKKTPGPVEPNLTISVLCTL